MLGAYDMASATQGKNPAAERIATEVRMTEPIPGGSKKTRFGVKLNIPPNKITALIGPSGCGKSTFLRTLNRMNETIRNTRVQGEILLDQQDIHGLDVVGLRRRVGMVFQRPNPFPKSIYENVAYGLRVNGFKGRLDDLVEKSLRRAAL